jgi:hypothetical protein
VADETTQQSSTDTAPEEQQPEVSGAVTPEDIEAYWRKRFSNSDKAHAEETRVLRQRLAALEAQAQATPGSTPPPELEARYQQMVKELQQKVAETERSRVVDTRRAKYPAAAENLGDDAVIAAMDEARMAALNERLTLEAPTRRIDANNPAKSAAGLPKQLSEMTADELRARLEQSSNEYANALRAR